MASANLWMAFLRIVYDCCDQVLNADLAASTASSTSTMVAIGTSAFACSVAGLKPCRVSTVCLSCPAIELRKFVVKSSGGYLRDPMMSSDSSGGANPGGNPSDGTTPEDSSSGGANPGDNSSGNKDSENNSSENKNSESSSSSNTSKVSHCAQENNPNEPCHHHNHRISDIEEAIENEEKRCI